MSRSGRILSGAFVGLVFLFLFLPAAIVVVFSFNSNPLIGFPFRTISLRWYRAGLQDPLFAAALKHTAIAAAGTAVIAGTLGTIAAFGIARARRSVTNGVTIALLLPAVMPPLVLAIGLLLMTNALKINQGLALVIAGHTLIALPFVLVIVGARLERLDPAPLEAARDLGATAPRAFRDVTFPLTLSAILGAFLVAAAVSVDEFIIAFFVSGNQGTLPVLIWGYVRQGTSPTVNALATLILGGSLTLGCLATLLARIRA